MLTKLICLGDSLTHGYNILPKDCWVALLNNEVDFPVINEGISGDTTAGMLARFHSEVKPQKPSHLILMGGSNDISLDMSIETVLGNVLAISRHAKRINCQIILGIPTSSFWKDASFSAKAFLDPSSFEKKLTALQNRLRNFSIEDELPYIDFSNLLQKEDFLADGVHPNEMGNIAMKNHVLKALNSLSLVKF